MIVAELQPGQRFINIETDGSDSYRQICLAKSLHPVHRDKMLIIWAVEQEYMSDPSGVSKVSYIITPKTQDAGAFVGQFLGDADKNLIQELLSTVWSPV